jgi:hypothetical protein
MKTSVAVATSTKIGALPPAVTVPSRPRLTLAHWLFLLFAAYLALPLYDVLLRAISLSAVLLVWRSRIRIPGARSIGISNGAGTRRPDSGPIGQHA